MVLQIILVLAVATALKDVQKAKDTVLKDVQTALQEVQTESSPFAKRKKKRRNKAPQSSPFANELLGLDMNIQQDFSMAMDLLHANLMKVEKPMTKKIFALQGDAEVENNILREWKQEHDTEKERWLEKEIALEGEMKQDEMAALDYRDITELEQQRENKKFDSSFDAFAPNTRKTLRMTIDSTDKFKKFLWNRHGDMIGQVDKDTDRMKTMVKKARKDAMKKMESEYAEEDMRREEVTANAQGVKAKSDKVADSVLETEESIDKSLEEAFDGVNEATATRMKFVGQLHDLLFKKNSGVVNKAQQQAREDRVQIGQSWRDVNKESAGMTEDVERAVADSSRSFLKGSDMMYGQMSSDVENLLDEKSAVENVVQETKDATGDATAAFAYGKKEFDDMKDAMKQKLKQAQEVLRLKIQSDAQKVKNEVKSGLITAVSQAQTRSAVELSQAAEGVVEKLSSMKDSTDETRDRFKNIVGNAKSRMTERKYAAQLLDKGLVDVRDKAEKDETLMQQVVQTAKDNSAREDKKFDDELADDKTKATIALTALKQEDEGFSKDAALEVDGLRTKLDEANNQMQPVQQHFDTEEEGQLDDMTKRKKDLATFIKKSLGDVQDELEKTGTLMNGVIPSVKKFAQGRGQAVLSTVTKMEAALKRGTTSAVALAGMAEADGGAGIQVDAAQFNEQMTSELRSNGARIQSENDGMSQQLQSRMDKLTSEGTNLKDLAGKTYKQAKGVTEKIGDDTKSVLDMINDVKNHALDMVQGSADTFERNVSAAERNVHSVLQKEMNAATAQIGKTRDAMKEETRNEEDKVKNVVQSDTEETEEVGAEMGQHYNGMLGDALERLRVLTASMKGEAANSTDWSNKLEEEITGVGADAHHAAIIGSKSRLERQAHIDKRFRAIQDKVHNDVEGISSEQQKAMSDLTTAAKKEAERIASDMTLSAEEQKARLQKVDQWLVSGLQDVSDDEGRYQKELNGMAMNAEEFAKSAASKVSELHTEMDALDAGRGVQNERNSMEQTSSTLDELIDGASAQAIALHEKAVQDVQNLKGTHAASGEELHNEVTSDIRNTDAELASAESRYESTTDSLAAGTQRVYDDVAQRSAQMERFQEKVAEQSKGLSERIGLQAADRKKKLDFLSEWQEGFSHTSAQTVEKIADVLLLMLKSSGAKFKSEKAEGAEFEKNIKGVMESEAMQILKKIGTADKSLDTITAKDAKMLTWTKKYDGEMSRWKDDVKTGLGTLTAGLEDELAKLQASAGHVEGDIEGAEGKTRSQVEAEIAAAKKAEDEAFARANAEFDKDMQKARAETTVDANKDATEAKAIYMAEMKKLEEEKRIDDGMFAARANLEKVMDESSGAAKLAAQQVLHVLDTQQAKVDDAQASIEDRVDKLHYLMTGVKPESLMEDDVPGLNENINLNAQHEALMQRVQKLESEAQQLRTEEVRPVA